MNGPSINWLQLHAPHSWCLTAIDRLTERKEKLAVKQCGAVNRSGKKRQCVTCWPTSHWVSIIKKWPAGDVPQIHSRFQEHFFHLDRLTVESRGYLWTSRTGRDRTSEIFCKRHRMLYPVTSLINWRLHPSNRCCSSFFPDLFSSGSKRMNRSMWHSISSRLAVVSNNRVSRYVFHTVWLTLLVSQINSRIL